MDLCSYERKGQKNSDVRSSPLDERLRRSCARTTGGRRYRRTSAYRAARADARRASGRGHAEMAPRDAQPFTGPSWKPVYPATGAHVHRIRGTYGSKALSKASSLSRRIEACCYRMRITLKREPFLIQFCEGLMHSAHRARVVLVDRIYRRDVCACTLQAICAQPFDTS